MKKIKPISTSTLMGLILVIVGGILFYYEQNLSAVLTLVLALAILSINIYLLTSANVFLKGKVTKKKLYKYKGFAKFYLRDRRMAYSKQNFAQAIENNWTDIVTMSLLLGIKKHYNEEEQAEVLLLALQQDQEKIYEVLLRGGFNGDFVVRNTEEHFIYETLRKPNTRYLKLLLECRISPNIKNAEGNTPIFETISAGAIEHMQVLIDSGASLEIQNKQKLTPLFYALKEGKIDICEKLVERVLSVKTKSGIQFKKVVEPILLNPLPEPNDMTDLLIRIIGSKDQKTLNVVKDYFQNKQDYFLKLETGVEMYARLSTIQATMEKKQVVGTVPSYMEKEEECKKDLYQEVLRQYKFSEIGDFKINGIYDTPKYIDSQKEPCSNCNASGEIKCIACDAKGIVSCPVCQGKGVHTCSKCQGTKKVSCTTVKKYIECHECKDGAFKCTQCDPKGMQVCPKCQGHGTEACKCPPDKKRKCPHCDKGYISLKNGMYKKCMRCNEGEICMLCDNTKWVKEVFKDKGYKCKECNGVKKVPCTMCRGTKKVTCTRKYEQVCDCKDGQQVCQTCSGNKVVACTQCTGTGKTKCPACVDGHNYTNIAVDFKAYQTLVSEQMLTATERSLLGDLVGDMSHMILEEHHFLSKVYTLKKIEMNKNDIQIRSNPMQKQVAMMLERNTQDRILDILELAPIDYTIVTFKHKEGANYQCILINDYFYKTIK